MENPYIHYIGGETMIYHNCDEDRWSLLEVVDFVTKIGYPKNGIAAMWFKYVTESIEEGLKMLRTDNDALELAKIGVRNDIVELYVVHKNDVIGQRKARGHVVGKDDNHKGSSSELGGGSAQLEDSESGSNNDSQDEDFESASDGSDSDLPWSDTKSEDSAHDIVFDDSGDDDDDGNVDGGLFDVKVKSLAEEENVLPEQHGQATPIINKGKEVAAAGFSEELPDLPSSDEEGDVPLKKYHLHKELKDMSQ
ncbi:hypothetical protein PIB30_078624 [Stylosanthes scabra]|uniref:PB1-like domain-containing protein n=1 Tax=Stylosanthes scabra TaxID=79078 RepID=A0ABU6SST6_9FABA|nr:hypothetical protein [Stylosanthes scabra]